MTSCSTAVGRELSGEASSEDSSFSTGLGVSVVLGVGLSPDRNKSSTVATTDCKASPSLPHQVVYFLKYPPFGYPDFSEFVLQVVLISAGVAAIVPECFQEREPCVLYDSSTKKRAQHSKNGR